MFEESLVAYHPATNVYSFSGGILDARAYIYRRSPAQLVGEAAFPGAGELPRGLIAGNSLTNPTSLFASFRSIGSTAALIHYPATGNDSEMASHTVFGTSGPGQVSAGVGGLAFGPDGLLNVIDTGDQRILRFDPVTLGFVSAFSLANTTTDNTSFTISSTGFVFTNDVAGGHGTIYNYATGQSVGHYTALSNPDEGNLGKLAMTADNNGLVYIYDTPSRLSVYDTNSLAAIPEPSTYALLAGLAALGLANRRKRRA
jgi:hypothetical protein